MSAQVVVSTRGLCKDRVTSFLPKRVRVISDLDLNILEGETYGLLGPNGAGKTTTIKILLGLLHPDSGEISVLSLKPGHPQALNQIGFLPENPYFYSHLTAAEFLDFIGQLFEMSKTLRKEKCKELLLRVGLWDSANMQMGKFSKGMLQRLGIAQSLMNDPKVLFLDEPMSGLDPIGRKDIKTILCQLKEKGKTIFFNSHLLPDVNEICDRVGVLHKGRLVSEDKISDISSKGDYRLLEDYFLEQVGASDRSHEKD
ncbi:MAG: ABC transporter ATP-binding protein [Candidatus Obscuribacterales bacterium]|nr:ABC transporter ATP-binding protein [Candidatus Obscuribacterales bacterium]